MDGFTRVLKDPLLKLNHLINEFAIPLYFEELKIDRCDIDVSYFKYYFVNINFKKIFIFYFYSKT